MKTRTKTRKKRKRKKKKVISDLPMDRRTDIRHRATSGWRGELPSAIRVVVEHGSVEAQKTPGGGRRSISASVLLVLLLSAFCLTALADSKSDARKPYALLFGTVYSASNHPVYGVKIKIRRADKKRAKWELYSDHQGEFAQRVPAGKADYVISTEAKKGQPTAETTIHIEADERKDFSLRLK